MRVRFTPLARADIDQIYEYLDERSPSGARNVLLAICAGVQFIAERPKGSEQTDDPEVRVKVVQRYRYKIFTPSLARRSRFSMFDTHRANHGNANRKEGT